MSRSVVVAVLVSTALALVAVPSTAEGSGQTPSQERFQQEPGWLQRWNAHRTASGLGPLTADPDRSAAIVEAVEYMARTGQVTHTLPDDAGERAQEAALSSNLSQDLPDTTPEEIIDRWFSDPAHALNMLRPQLTLTGFGQAVGQPDLVSGAWTLTRESDPVPPDISYPYAFPGDGATVSLTSYDGFARPDPLTHCEGYQAPSGQPAILQVDDPFADTHDIGSSAMVDVGTGAAVEHCLLVGEEYRNDDPGQQQLLRDILRNTVTVIPRAPLVAGTYQVTVAVDGQNVSWSFTVQPGGSGPSDDGDPQGPVTGEVDASDPRALSVVISRTRFADAGAVHAVLASAELFPDALAGSALSGQGPMLLTPQASLAPDVSQELERVLAPGGTVYLLGGDSALSPEVESAVAGLGFEPERLAGPTRVETAIRVAETAVALYGGQEAVIARAFAQGADETAAWADSVAVGAYTATHGLPVLLTDTASLHPATAAALDRLGITTTTVVGGTAAVSDEVMAALPAPTRIAGASRTGTATAIAENLVGNTSGAVLIDGFAGDGWTGGLAGAGLAADRGWPVLLANGDRLPSDTAAVLPGCGSQVVVVGTTAFVQSLRSDLAAVVDANC